ncbi:MAG: ABC transporter substrate-binding protein [Thermoproteales archaeon]|nr:ABC transporter substrate-binding protein [Thermoproteales archaeon]
MLKKFITVSMCMAICLMGTMMASAMSYNEAPMLKTMVAAGELPPVEKRLPEEPLVVKAGVDISAKYLKFEIGKYGGTLRVAAPQAPGGGEWWTLTRESLLRQVGLGVPGELPEGNIFKAFDMSKDAKTFTFYLRKGMKWSDGAPVTTEDVRFAYEDVLLNKELTPTFPSWLSSTDGTPCELDIVDDYTFRLIFKESYGLFPYVLSLRWQTWDAGPLLQPSHYMKKFHIKYTPLEQLKPLLKKNGLGEKEWARLYQLYSWQSGTVAETKIGCPTLTPYVLVDMPSSQVAIGRRNPYYWRVDAAGNQLPYIDEVRMEAVARPEMILMKVVSGQVDWALQSVSLKDLPLYKEKEEKGGYNTILLGGGGSIAITFNYSNPDLVWRKIIWDKRFREALNLAIDREEVINSLFYGMAEPVKIIPGEYNPAKANQLLDSMGLDKRDAEGWRLRPDGKRMELLIETSGGGGLWIPLSELLVDYWKSIGIYTRMKYEEASLLTQRIKANETQVLVNSWLDTIVINHNPYMIDWVFLNDPTKISQGFYEWYTSKGKKGMEPPEEFKPLFTLYDKMRSSRSPMEIKKYLEAWRKTMHDTLFLLVPVEAYAGMEFYSKKLGNTTVLETPEGHVWHFAVSKILFFK